MTGDHFIYTSFFLFYNFVFRFVRRCIFQDAFTATSAKREGQTLFSLRTSSEQHRYSKHFKMTSFLNYESNVHLREVSGTRTRPSTPTARERPLPPLASTRLFLILFSYFRALGFLHVSSFFFRSFPSVEVEPVGNSMASPVAAPRAYVRDACYYAKNE